MAHCEKGNYVLFFAVPFWRCCFVLVLLFSADCAVVMRCIAAHTRFRCRALVVPTEEALSSGLRIRGGCSWSILLHIPGPLNTAF